MAATDSTDTNISALNKLRSLPRGTQVESRISAIKNLLGDVEIFRTIKDLRWPLGVICPHCHSHNIVKIAAPKDATDDRQYYECLECKDDGEPSEFDDLTGLGDLGETLAELRQWVLCWYLIGFCSISQIARVLGLSMHEVIHMAELGAQLTEAQQKSVNQLESTFLKTKAKEKQVDAKKEQVAGDEYRTRSRSLGKFKPGPKSSA